MNGADGGPERLNQFQQIGLRVFRGDRNHRNVVQRLVGIVGGGGTILVGVVNTLVFSTVNQVGLVEGFSSSFTGLLLLMGLVFIACAFWDHPIARWIQIALFVFAGIFGALSANRGNITSAFFLVFAIILLVEYGVRRKPAWALAFLMLSGYVAALSVGYGASGDVPRPVISSFASLLTVLTFVGLFGGVILRHRTQLSRDAADLEDRISRRTADLHRALSERTVMLQEIHHRVKNNMQTVSTLLGMEADRTTDAGARDALNASRQRIQAMAGVHDALYRSERLDEVDLSQYTTDLVDTLLQLALCPVELDLQVSEAGTVNLSIAVSLGLVLNELVSNALQHGFDSTIGGKLRVSLTSDDNVVVLEVEDDGAGLPDGFQLEGFEPEGQSGVGMSVVNSIVKYRRGTIDFTSDGGTCWRLEIPISNNGE